MGRRVGGGCGLLRSGMNRETEGLGCESRGGRARGEGVMNFLGEL